MTIAAIWAQEMNGGIGYQGRLPWRHKPDIEHFWKTIGNDTVVIGNTTFGKNATLFQKRRTDGHYIVLSNRTVGNLMLERNSSIHYVSNIGGALNLIKNFGENAWVVGGAKTFALFASVIDVFVMTKIYNRYPCDTYMPWGVVPPNTTAWDFYNLKPNAEGVEATVGVYVSNRLKNPDLVVTNLLKGDIEWEL